MGWKDVVFPASQGSIMRKGQAVAGGTGPVRMKKGPGLVQSLIGMLIGVAFLIGSPLVMWYAQSQHSADDFTSAISVDAESSEVGYITFRGEPRYVEEGAAADCLVGNCLYQTESQQEQVTVEDLVCGSNVKSTSDMRVLQQNGSECDENGDCVPCYDVERDEWEERASNTTYHEVQVGSYTVDPRGAVMLDTESKTLDTGVNEDFNPTRSVYSYFSLPSNLLVAGYSDGSRVTGGGELTYILSQFDPIITLQKLEERDEQNQRLLWIVTFVMLVIGLSLIFGPLQWMGRQMRFVPVVGPMLSKGSTGLLGFAALLLAIPLWIVLFVVITILKSWWIAVLLVVLLGIFLIWRAKKS